MLSKPVIFLALGLMSFTACENDIEKIKLITGKNNLPVETAGELTVLYSDSAKLKVRMTAKEMQRFSGEQPRTLMNKGIKVVFFDQDKNTSTTLTAGRGIRYEGKQTMEAYENVVVINSKNEKLNTEHLVWDEKSAKIFSDNFVKITTKDQIIFGNGFESNQDFTKYKIYKIRGTISLKKPH